MVGQLSSKPGHGLGRPERILIILCNFSSVIEQ